ncbi:hypothetical protein [Ornithinimicrobium kibberense]|uniref:hypothetical protein n=1 Tax=Ornithinimicrobium kibberense TaxID=282060 RepID=UPI00361F4EB1
MSRWARTTCHRVAPEATWTRVRAVARTACTTAAMPTEIGSTTRETHRIVRPPSTRSGGPLHSTSSMTTTSQPCQRATSAMTPSTARVTSAVTVSPRSASATWSRPRAHHCRSGREAGPVVRVAVVPAVSVVVMTGSFRC